METASKENLKVLIKKIYKAFEIEEEAHYTNISGKKENFSNFIIKALKFIYQANPENLFEKLIKQISFYENIFVSLYCSLNGPRYPFFSNFCKCNGVRIVSSLISKSLSANESL